MPCSFRIASYVELKNHADALVDFSRAIELDSTFAAAYFNRGTTYRKLAQLEAALADYIQALHYDPENVDACFNIGTMIYGQGKPDQALHYFERAAQLGDQQAAEKAAIIREQQEQNSGKLALFAFQLATSRVDISNAVVQFPFMTDSQFIAAIEQAIAQQVLPELRPPLELRLAWLREIAQGRS